MVTKPFSQDAKQPVIAARLDRETYEALKNLAEEQRRPLGSLVRLILEDFVSSRSATSIADVHTSERAAD